MAIRGVQRGGQGGFPKGPELNPKMLKERDDVRDAAAKTVIQHFEGKHSIQDRPPADYDPSKTQSAMRRHGFNV